MGRRPLVIIGVLGVLVGAAGLAQARGGHGGHHGHSRPGGPHHGDHGHAVPGLGSTAACWSPPREDWRRRPRWGVGRRQAIRLAMIRWASILRSSDVPTRGGAPRP
jgi:hypothetical protein